MQADFLENVTNINLEVVITLETISQQKKIFTDSLSARKPINLISDNVKLVDTASMQLLFAFIRSARIENLQVTWHYASPAILESASLLGLSADLNLSSIG